MSRIAILTARDEGHAAVAIEALDAAGIPAEIRRQARVTYLGGATSIELEVRVDPDRVPAARAVLARLEAEVAEEAASLAAQADPTPREPAAEVAEAVEAVEAPPGPRLPRLWMLFPIEVCVPFAALGCVYARARRLGPLLVSASVTGTVLFLVTQHRLALTVAVCAKALDVALSPWLVARANRRLGGNESVRLGAVLSVALFLAGGLAVYGHLASEEDARKTREAERLFGSIARDPAGLPQPPAHGPGPAFGLFPLFPDVPVGRAYDSIVASSAKRRAAMVDANAVIRAEEAAWSAAPDPPPEPWLIARQAAVTALRGDLDKVDGAIAATVGVLDREARRDERADEIRAWFRRSLEAAEAADDGMNLRNAMRALGSAWERRVELLRAAHTDDTAATLREVAAREADIRRRVHELAGDPGPSP